MGTPLLAGVARSGNVNAFQNSSAYSVFLGALRV